MKTRFSFVFLLAVFPTLLWSQDYKADILQALTVYKQPRLQLDSKIDVYANYSATQPSQSYKGTVKKNGLMYYSEMEGVRMLMNEKYLVMVYESEHQVVCTKRDKKSDKKLNKNSGDPTASIDSLLARNDSIVYKGVHDGLKTYIIYTNKSIIRRTEIYLDTKNGYVSQLVYFYNEELMPLANKVRIQYTVTLNPSFSENEFSEKRFVTFSRGDAAAAGECAGYQVLFIDNENNEPIEK